MSAVLSKLKSNQISIETAGFADEGEVHDFYQAQKTALGPFAYFLKGKSEGDIAGLLKKGAVFVARDGDAGPIAGMVAVTPTKFSPKGQTGAYTPDLHHAFTMAACAEVNSLVIAPEHARKGIATALLTSCKTWAKPRHITHLFGKVVCGALIHGENKPGNVAARAAFVRQGYRYIGETKRNTDPNVDLWVLGKAL